MWKLRAMKSMSFTVFSYNATVGLLLIQPNPTQPITCAGKCNPTQPIPWMDPTHVHLWCTHDFFFTFCVLLDFVYFCTRCERTSTQCHQQMEARTFDFGDRHFLLSMMNCLVRSSQLPRRLGVGEFLCELAPKNCADLDTNAIVTNAYHTETVSLPHS